MLAVAAALLAAAVIGAQAVYLLRGRPADLSRAARARAARVPAPRAAAPVDVPVPAGTATAAARRRDPVATVVEVLRTRRWARRGLSLLSVGLLVAAVGVLGYPFYTNLYQSRVQARLDRQLASPELEQAYREGRVEVGDSLTRIIIPTIDVNVVVVQGTTADALRAGAGHYPSTPLPCEPGNVAIAGHRTTYGKPFHNVDRMKPGDTIVLQTPLGSCTYEVSQPPFEVMPDDLSVLEQSSERTLTLTTCHPKGSAARRLIIKARLVSSDTAQA